MKNIHWSFWVIGVVTLIWNAMGAANYVAQLDPVVVATFPESHRVLIEGRPAWATGAFAIAVFGGTIGCVLLLFKKSISHLRVDLCESIGSTRLNFGRVSEEGLMTAF